MRDFQILKLLILEQDKGEEVDMYFSAKSEPLAQTYVVMNFLKQYCFYFILLTSRTNEGDLLRL